MFESVLHTGAVAPQSLDVRQSTQLVPDKSQTSGDGHVQDRLGKVLGAVVHAIVSGGVTPSRVIRWTISGVYKQIGVSVKFPHGIAGLHWSDRKSTRLNSSHRT